MRRIAQGVLVLAALALLASSWRCDEAWFDRHVFLPQQFFIAASHGIVVVFRVLSASLAAVLLLVVPFLPRGASGRRLLIAVLLTLPVTELVLRWRMHHLVRAELIAAMDALTSPHPRYGVTFNPSMDRFQLLAGRQIRFRTDLDRRRVGEVAVDPSLPTLVFTGESAVAGFGLQWEETFPALLGTRLQQQIVNLASPAYRIEQSLLRLQDELPKLAHPVAVIGMFMPGLLGRSLVARREGGGVFRGSGFYRLWTHLYWSDAALDEAMRSVGRALRQMAALAAARGARCIFVVTGQTPQWMVHSLLEVPGLDFVVIDLPENELLAEGHPGPQGSIRIADALEARLRAATAERR
jgi:hypothetical protein